MFSEYAVSSTVFDELRNGAAAIGSQWEGTVQTFQTLGHKEIDTRQEQGLRDLARNGITYNPHDDDLSHNRPAQLNILPYNMLLSEWKKTDRGIQQWARLGELVLKDLFGPQTVIQEKIVPPDLLYANPKYHPAYHVVHEPDASRLHLSALDLARSRDGRWWTTGFRTASPVGLGYVIENRLMMGQLCPELYGDRYLMRIAPFFADVRELMSSLAPVSAGTPRIVLWSPGPDSETYFEDAYLARYLNYTLVLSGDLTVRRERMFLKTLRGLAPVDVILRRVVDDSCDSIELDNRSRVGVAGLVETVRSGALGLSNGLGCALLEAPMYFAYAHSLARHFLGETLELPPVATWWCGEEKGLKYVLANLDTLAIRDSFASVDTPSVLAATLPPKERDELIAQIKENPASFVGQEQVRRSTAPVWKRTGIQPFELAIRGFCVSREDTTRTLEGGLATTSALAADGTEELYAHDVRIVSETPVERVSLLAPNRDAIELRRGTADLPSRVCDNFFWIGRTLERMDTMIRVQRIASRVAIGDYDASLVGRFLDRSFAPDTPAASAPVPPVNAPNKLRRREVFEKDHPGGLQTLAAQAVNLASTVRDRIALEMWRTFRGIEDKNAALYDARNAGDAEVKNRLDDLLGGLSGLFGLIHESMTRTDSWIFLDLGRRIERALQTSRIIRVNLPGPEEGETATLELLLEIVDSIMTYRGRYLAATQLAPVLDLLVCDDSNPRSVAFQLSEIYGHINKLHRHEGPELPSRDRQIALTLHSTIQLLDVRKMAKADSKKRYGQLHKQLHKLESQLAKLSDTVSAQYLVHAGLPRHYATLND